MNPLLGDPTEIFRQEADELFTQLESALLDLEKRPDDKELVASAFRALHTIKGSGAMCGFDAMARFAHHLESVFDRVRNGQVRITPALISVTLRARDHLRQLLADPTQVPRTESEAILASLAQAISGERPVDTTAAAPAATVSTSPATTPSPTSAVVRSTPVPSPPPVAPRGYRITFALPPQALVNGTSPIPLLRELLELGSGEVMADAAAIPPLDALDPEQCLLRWQVRLVTEAPRDAIEGVFLFVRQGMELVIDPLESTAIQLALTESSEEISAPSPAGVAIAGSACPVGDVVTDPRATTGTAQPSAVVGTAASVPAGEEVADTAPPALVPTSRAASTTDAPDAPSVTHPTTPSLVTNVLKVNAERVDSLMNQVGELVIAQSRLKQIAHAATEYSPTALRAIAEEMGRLVSELRDTTMG
ncbi:MAG: Hpt domain-containing protein, partial [Magnetococcales bacterium]|nr:Hpt domain-containing protein [Magnetococcales bacterium]